MTDKFKSSDANRSGKPLRFARNLVLHRPIELRSGRLLPRVDVTYETYGQLSEAKDNAVMICHALSGDSHVAAHDDQDDPGWWDIMVGPGRPIDTNRYFVICSNVLGGCRGTTGPNSANPDTGRPYGSDFPLVTVEDMVDVQAALLDQLGIEKLMAVVGGSLGGHQALCWATRHGSRVGACAAIATSPALTSQALAFDVVGRNAILRDPLYHEGQYYDQETKPDVGLAVARMLAHITYLSPESMALKFDADRMRPRDIPTAFEKRFSVGSYLAYQGDRFVERFDANSYIVLSMAMDMFDLGRTKERLARVLSKTTCRWLVISFTSDWLFPARQSQQIVDALVESGKHISYCNVESPSGHDAFLLEDSFATYGELTRAFLCHANGELCGDLTVSSQANGSRPTSIFHHRRLDYDVLADLIEPGASVLDLGCGQGELLQKLSGEKGCHPLVGVELSEAEIVGSLQRGLDVLQADLNEGLPNFSDGQFDYVVLSQTLQSVVRTEAMVDEMLRVGNRCIVSFPNFGYRKLRRMLAEEGVSPASDTGILHYEWFNTPNRRFLTVKDWEQFCARRGITIHQEIFFDTETGERIEDDPNLNADLAIAVISR
jgi:homoserine O-acetyltransferase